MTTLTRRIPDAIVATWDSGPLYVHNRLCVSDVELHLGDTLIELSQSEADHLARSIAPEVCVDLNLPDPEDLMSMARQTEDELITAITVFEDRLPDLNAIPTLHPEDLPGTLEDAADAITDLLTTLRVLREDLRRIGDGS